MDDVVPTHIEQQLSTTDGISENEQGDIVEEEDVLTSLVVDTYGATRFNYGTEETTEPDGIIIVDENDVEIGENIETIVRPTNSYAAKKTVAQGMMDIALITANANQLRYLIELNSSSPTYYAVLFLIGVSLSLQVAVGIALIFKGRLDIRGESKNPQANRLNNYIVVGIFVTTVANVFIASFTTIAPNVESIAYKT